MKPPLLLWASAAIAVYSLRAAPARACGVSASGVSSCSLAEHDEAVRPHWAVAASALYTSTRLRFSGDLHADQVRYATLASIAYLPTAKLVLQLGAGVAFGGWLTLPDARYELSPGPTALLGADYRAFDDGRYFLILTSALSFATARTQAAGEASASYSAFDLRLGTQFGRQLYGGTLRAYAAARVFGGPIFWHYQNQAVTGTDTHHYQLGGGFAVRISRAVHISVEGIPFGEQALSLGVGFVF